MRSIFFFLGGGGILNDKHLNLGNYFNMEFRVEMGTETLPRKRLPIDQGP